MFVFNNYIKSFFLNYFDLWLYFKVYWLLVFSFIILSWQFNILHFKLISFEIYNSHSLRIYIIESFNKWVWIFRAEARIKSSCFVKKLN